MPPHPSDAEVLAARRAAWLTLSLTAGLGPITLRRAVEAGFGVLGALGFSHTAWAEVEGIGTYRATQILKDLPRAAREAHDLLARCQDHAITLFTPEDDTYPALCRDLPDAPPVLYVRGRLEPRDLNSIAIVGSRQCSHYGRDQASRLAALLAGAGLTVISGGARGVDSAAHEGALRSSDGRTLAVLGCGVDLVYPPENAPLFDRILRSGQGALVSHYPPGTPPHARHFPERNRLISALSRGVLVIEADLRSGSLITARIAVDDHNRPVLALPGRVDNPLSAGPHELIRQGAALVTCLEDILEALGPVPDSAFKARRHPPLPDSPLAVDPPPAASRPTLRPAPPDAIAATPDTAPPPVSGGPPVSPADAAILAALREHGEAPPDLLIDATGLPAAVVLQQLTLLTLKGRVRRIDAQTYTLPARK